MRRSTLSAGILLLAASQAAFAQAPQPGAPAASPTQAPETKPTEAKPTETKPTAPPAKTPGTAATVVSLKTIESVMGKAVRSRAANEDMGHIVDVLVDGAGQIRAAVIDFGGFLGVGSRKVAVDWKTLDFADSITSGSVKVNLTRDQIRQAPEVKADEPVVVLEDAASMAKDAVSATKDANGAAKPAAAPAPSAGHNETAPAR